MTAECNESATEIEQESSQSRRRRALNLGYTEHFTDQEFGQLKRSLGNRCGGCWKTEHQLKRLGCTLVPDHIVPLANGGLDDITPMQPLCQGKGGCNNAK